MNFFYTLFINNTIINMIPSPFAKMTTIKELINTPVSTRDSQLSSIQDNKTDSDDETGYDSETTKYETDEIDKKVITRSDVETSENLVLKGLNVSKDTIEIICYGIVQLILFDYYKKEYDQSIFLNILKFTYSDRMIDQSVNALTNIFKTSNIDKCLETFWRFAKHNALRQKTLIRKGLKIFNNLDDLDTFPYDKYISQWDMYENEINNMFNTVYNNNKVNKDLIKKILLSYNDDIKDDWIHVNKDSDSPIIVGTKRPFEDISLDDDEIVSQKRIKKNIPIKERELKTEIIYSVIDELLLMKEKIFEEYICKSPNGNKMLNGKTVVDDILVNKEGYTRNKNGKLMVIRYHGNYMWRLHKKISRNKELYGFDLQLLYNEKFNKDGNTWIMTEYKKPLIALTEKEGLNILVNIKNIIINSYNNYELDILIKKITDKVLSEDDYMFLNNLNKDEQLIIKCVDNIWYVHYKKPIIALTEKEGLDILINIKNIIANSISYNSYKLDVLVKKIMDKNRNNKVFNEVDYMFIKDLNKNENLVIKCVDHVWYVQINHNTYKYNAFTEWWRKILRCKEYVIDGKNIWKNDNIINSSILFDTFSCERDHRLSNINKTEFWNLVEKYGVGDRIREDTKFIFSSRDYCLDIFADLHGVQWW